MLQVFKKRERISFLKGLCLIACFALASQAFSKITIFTSGQALGHLLNFESEITDRLGAAQLESVSIKPRGRSELKDFYFDLTYRQAGSSMTTQIGAVVRSGIFDIPVGDSGTTITVSRLLKPEFGFPIP